MLLKHEKNSFESSMFYKTNMKINRNLPKVYLATLVIAVIIGYIGTN
ncbi:hypothetical protein ACMC56_01430 [Campylobacterota bacterium DY0563]|nr:hypothetical protein [Halarcobacter sp.]